MQPMRIAIVYNFFPHYRSGILRELARNSNNEYLFVGSSDALDLTIKVYREKNLNFVTTSCFQFKNILIQTGLIQLAARKDLDAIIYLGNPYYLMTWISSILARITGKRVLFWTHGWVKNNEKDLKSWVRVIFYKLAHGLLLYGQRARNIGLLKGFNPNALYVIYNSLDYDLQKELRSFYCDDDLYQIRKNLFKNPEYPLIICTARITSICRFDLLFDAVENLRNQGVMANILLVGDGPEKSKLMEDAQLKLLPVNFYGPCYDEKTLAGLIMAANITVSPGKVGLTAIHSLVYGTPVITHNNFNAQMPEYEAIIPSLTGDFFEYNNSNSLAKVIKKWINKPKNEETKKKCYEIIDRFYNPQFQRLVIEHALKNKPTEGAI